MSDTTVPVRPDGFPPEARGASTKEKAMLLAGIYMEFRHGAELYADLLSAREQGATAEELSDRALSAARELAVAQRGAWATIRSPDHNLLVGLPAVLDPVRTLGAMQRLCYALAGLADEDAPPELLLSRAELAGLAEQYELQSWIDAIHGQHAASGTDED